MTLYLRPTSFTFPSAPMKSPFPPHCQAHPSKKLCNHARFPASTTPTRQAELLAEFLEISDGERRAVPEYAQDVAGMGWAVEVDDSNEANGTGEADESGVEGQGKEGEKQEKEEEQEEKKWLIGIVGWKSLEHHQKCVESEAMKPFLERSFKTGFEEARMCHVEFWEEE